MMKECPGVNSLCCTPICDWEDYCEECLQLLKTIESAKGKENE